MEVDHSKRAFIPTFFEVASLIFISLLALVAVNLIPTLQAGRTESYTLYSGYLKDFIENLVAPIENQQTSNLIVIVFWGAIGIIAYLAVWLAATVVHAYKTDLPPSKGFILPQGMVHKDIWYSAIGRALVRVLATIGFLYWLYLLLGSIFPFASSSFLEAVTELPRMWPLVVFSSVVFTSIGLFVAIILLRCVFLRERVFRL